MPVTANRPCTTLVAAALTAAVAFAAACGEPTDPTNSKSRLQINVATIGVDYDPDGYLLRGVDIEQAVASGPAVTVYRWLWPGSYDVQLDGLAANCNLSGPAVVSVTIVAGQMSSVSFAVECHATTGSLLVATPTRGRDFTTASYAIVVDGAGVHRAPLRLDPDAEWSFRAVVPATYSYELRDLAANCVVNGSNTRSVPVTAGDTAEVLFNVACSRVP